jgi:hypothetical protein
MQPRRPSCKKNSSDKKPAKRTIQNDYISFNIDARRMIFYSINTFILKAGLLFNAKCSRCANVSGQPRSEIHVVHISRTQEFSHD